VVADIGYGVDSYYSFFLMDDTRVGKDRTIDYGFKSDIEGLHVISSEWLWDWNAIGLVYESLMGRKPYDKSIGAYSYWLATDYTIGSWTGGTEVNFTIRSDAVWQDGVAFTAADVVFSYEFTRHCGKGVAWNFAGVQYLNSTWAEGNKVIFRMNVDKALTGQEDPGFLPIIPKHIWEAKFPDWEDWYDEATGTWSDDRMAVRDWLFWDEPHPIYNSTNPHPTNGVLTKAIGTGAWIFVSHTEGQYIAFNANEMYYKTHAELLAAVKEMFWAGSGDANRNMRIDGPDKAMLHAAWPPAAYDPDVDFNEDMVIDGLDAFLIAKNYGRRG
jgi:ABC-type transport system substrate-binding protein